MLRPSSPAQAAAPTAPLGSRSIGASPNDPGGWRRHQGRDVAHSVASGTLTNENKTYLAQLVAQRTGVSQQEAEKRSMMPVQRRR
jgi:hypothetical protein